MHVNVAGSQPDSVQPDVASKSAEPDVSPVDAGMHDIQDADAGMHHSPSPLADSVADVTMPDQHSDESSERIIASRVQRITAAVAHAEKLTSAFAHVIADVESCKELAGQHSMLVAVGTGSTVDNMVRQYSKAAKSAPLSTSACLLVPHWPQAKFNHDIYISSFKGYASVERVSCRNTCQVSNQVAICTADGGFSLLFKAWWVIRAGHVIHR